MLSAHPFWSLEVLRLDGQLLLTPCPGSQQVALTRALAQLQLAGAGGVLTLMTQEELTAQGLTDLGPQVDARGMAWFHLPIADDQAPDVAFEQAWPRVLPELLALLREGRHLVIHCHGGSGRTGLAAALLLMTQGLPQQEAMAVIRARRPRAFTLACHRHWLDTRGRELAGLD
ncbi:tyrosine-protein phosphatase [Aeromonas sp. FDAARGOS 1415]|uniref:phosphatase domain-containing protein n=1 Tax=Aeromonas TaxID=642 RepID=UPI001C249B3F|nr:tyrosine-protein phosphatase [Aeromonas sp. FDAARGOS 1415]QXB55606.1 tyrosine-protein phosphatase [Aeromonas sp. FDAARGOS 1415]